MSLGMGKGSTAEVRREWSENNDSDLRERDEFGHGEGPESDLRGRFGYSREETAACQAAHRPHA